MPSIAMATYNGGRYLPEQLRSFAAQTRQPDELVVTDDGSTDDTLAILERFSAPFPVRVYRNTERLNYARNFELAISLCTDDIIFLSDQDDVWFPDKIERVVAEFERNPTAQVVINDQILTDANLNHSGITKLTNLRRIGKGAEGLVEGCCTALRREFAERIFPMPPTDLIQSRELSHDSWINELAQYMGVRVVLPVPLQYFRRTGENATSWVVSEPRKVGMADQLAQRKEAAPTEAWLRRVAVLDLYRELVSSPRLSHERESILARAAISSPLDIWKLWRSGGYDYFNGWKSAANDLV